MPATTGNFWRGDRAEQRQYDLSAMRVAREHQRQSERGGLGQPSRVVCQEDGHRRRVRASAPRCPIWRFVQNRMPTRSIVSFLIVSRVRASFSICTPFLPSAAGMSWSSSWLPRMPNTP